MANPGPIVTDPWATCTSDADGDCSFIVPNTQSGGANRNDRFWVEQTAAPTGWFTNPTLGTGPIPNTVVSNYRFLTGESLTNGITYSSTQHFMVGTGSTINEASSGIWQNSRNNPAPPVQCGLDVALIIDVSGSVGSALPSLKAAANTFVDSLVGTPSRMSMFTFANTAPAPGANNANLDTLQPVSTSAGATVVKNRIGGLTSNGSTNWDRGLGQAAESANFFDVAIVITDGDPTVYNRPTQGPGDRTRFREVENGIFSANALKVKGTRIVAFGVGSGVGSAASGRNLRSISGPTLNTDYFQTTDYAAAGSQLRALALGACQGSISVIKQIVPPGGTITQAVPAGGWTFSAATTTAGVGIAPASGQTAPGTGALNFSLTFPGGTTTAPINVVETQQTGHTVVLNGGRNATCTRLDTGATAPGYDNGPSPEQFTVTGSSTYPVSCIVYNRAPQPQATMRVDKQWVVVSNGVSTTYANPDQPSVLQAALTIDGIGQGFGTTVTGLNGRFDARDRRDNRAVTTLLHADIVPGDSGQRRAHERKPAPTLQRHARGGREHVPHHEHRQLPDASSSSSRTASTARLPRPRGTSRRGRPRVRRPAHSWDRSASPASTP